MLVRKVRMDGVGGVDGEHGGCRHGAVSVFLRALCGECDAIHDGVKVGGIGALRRAAADLFVVRQEDDGRDAFGGLGVDQAADGRMAGRQIVQPRRADERIVQTDDGRGLDVVEEQLRVQNRVDLLLGGFGKFRHEFIDGFAGEEGRHLRLRVEREAVVDAVVQMDREIRDDGDGAVDVDKGGLRLLFRVKKRDAAGHAERTVLP